MKTKTSPVKHQNFTYALMTWAISSWNNSFQISEENVLSFACYSQCHGKGHGPLFYLNWVINIDSIAFFSPELETGKPNSWLVAFTDSHGVNTPTRADAKQPMLSPCGWTWIQLISSSRAPSTPRMPNSLLPSRSASSLVLNSFGPYLSCPEAFLRMTV